MNKPWAIFVAFCLAMASGTVVSSAEESISQRLASPPGGSIEWALGTGCFLPNESDLESGLALSLGMKFVSGKDSVFFDIIYSSTETGIYLPDLDGSVKNTLIQIGYMSGFGKSNRFRFGAGFQTHEMNISNINRMTGTTIVMVGEYDLRRRLALRLQTSYAVNRKSIAIGDDLSVLLYHKL